MSSSRAARSSAKLSRLDTISIIIGIVVGAGIYETAPLVMSSVSSEWQAIGVWVIGGVLSLVGALCYAELASTYPGNGGDYEYLGRAYGSAASFLFAWAQLVVLLTGSIAMMAYIAADYARVLVGGGSGSSALYATLAVLLLSVVNVLGTRKGKRTQNLLTAAKVIGIAGIVLSALLVPHSEAATSGPVLHTPATGSLGLALVFVLYTFGGWNDAAFVVSEVDNPRKNVPRALIAGVAAVLVIYLVVNLSFLYGLGFAGARSSDAIAADVLTRAFGPAGGRAMAALVVISALGAVNGMILTGSRVYARLGHDYPLFGRLGQTSRFGTPAWSLGVQAAITIALVLLLGTAAGRGGIDRAFWALGLAAPSWQGSGGFDALLRCTAPAFWFFFALTSVSLFVLRVRDRARPRPFVVPLYPIVPLAFTATCIFMLHAAVRYAGLLTLIGLVPVALGIPVFLASRRGGSAPPSRRGESQMIRIRHWTTRVAGLGVVLVALIACNNNEIDAPAAPRSQLASSPPASSFEPPRASAAEDDSDLKPASREPDVIFVPTPQVVVDRMLELTQPKPGEMVYDLGCGDGRIVVTAAKKYGAEGRGFDIDPQRVIEARKNVADSGVDKLVKISQQDIFTLDLSEADVITLYLLPELNVKLIPQLDKLRPGVRIVSHDFDMRGVEPDRVEQVENHTVYLWTTPLRKTKQL